MSDLGKNFDQLERQLGVLRQEIAGLAQGAPGSEPLAAPSAHRTPPPPVHEVSPEPERARPAAAPPPARFDGFDRLRAEIEQLLAVRDRLLLDARELVRTYERQLDALEAGQAEGLLGAASAPSPEPPAPGLAPRPAFFEGQVRLVVSGAQRIQTVQVLEDSLSRVDQVQGVYVRRVHRGEAWIELALAGGVELIGELNRVLPFPFAVQSASGQEVVLTLQEEA